MTSVDQQSLMLMLILARQTETDLAEYKQQAKLIFRRLTPSAEPKCSIESGKCNLHYVISNGIVYLTIADKSYPRKLAFSYLDEVSKEFERSYAGQSRELRVQYCDDKHTSYMPCFSAL